MELAVAIIVPELPLASNGPRRLGNLLADAIVVPTF